jgi:hypothetical protein
LETAFTLSRRQSKNPRCSAGDIQITALPDLKASRPWYNSIDSTVLQQNVKGLDTAYKNFFEGRGFPQFKNRSNFTSFTFVMGVKIQGELILKIEYLAAKPGKPVKNVEIAVTQTSQTEMVKNSSVLNAGITNTLISVLQKR